MWIHKKGEVSVLSFQTFYILFLIFFLHEECFFNLKIDHKKHEESLQFVLIFIFLTSIRLYDRWLIERITDPTYKTIRQCRVYPEERVIQHQSKASLIHVDPLFILTLVRSIKPSLLPPPTHTHRARSCALDPRTTGRSALMISQQQI